MSRFLTKKRQNLKTYTPGEQPRDRQFIKLNTNESPFLPSAKAISRLIDTLQNLQLYPDPTCKKLSELIAEHFCVEPSEVLIANGSDDILNYIYMAFCDENSPAIFPDITYGLHTVLSDTNGIPYIKIPLKADLSIDPKDYYNQKGTIFITNPNAPTGIALTPCEIKDILSNNPDNIVVIDEAYVDFGAKSCAFLVKDYPNLIVVQTFSKSRSLAGARIGFCIAQREVILDLGSMKYSLNPYSVNTLALAAGCGAISDGKYTTGNCQTIIKNRKYTSDALKELGFKMTDSVANFIFVRHDDISGAKLYDELRKRGILVRHFDTDRISEYIRITIGSRQQMETLVKAIQDIGIKHE